MFICLIYLNHLQSSNSFYPSCHVFGKDLCDIHCNTVDQTQIHAHFLLVVCKRSSHCDWSISGEDKTTKFTPHLSPHPFQPQHHPSLRSALLYDSTYRSFPLTPRYSMRRFLLSLIFLSVERVVGGRGRER